MTGAGSAKLAWAIETGFDDGPGTLATWRKPGENLEVGDASLENQLTRVREPDKPLPIGSREGPLEGAFSVTFELTDQDYHEMVFPESDGSGNDNTRLSSGGTRVPTATWYLSSQLPSQTEERFLTGAAVTEWSWQYNQGEYVSVDLTFVYTDEPDELFKSTDTTTSGVITPASSEVSVQTSSVDTGEVVLYDGNGDELDRVDANSTTYQNTTTVNGTDIESIRLVRSGSAVTGETVSVNDDVDGSGTDTDTSVDTEDVLGTPSTIVTPSKSEVVAWHDIDWEIDGVGVDTLQSMNISLSNMARMQRVQQRKAYRAVQGGYEPSFSVEAILEDDRQRKLGYGSSVATEPLESIDETDTTVVIGSLNDLDVLGAQPNSYSWNALVSADEDTTENVDYHINDIQVVQS